MQNRLSLTVFKKNARNRWVVQLALRLLVLLTLTGTTAQFLLQGFTLPDETPRAAIERLTGIDISPADSSHSSMMHMHHHHGDHSQESCALCPLLILTAIILSCLPVLPACTFERYRLESQSHQPRAPPRGPRTLPPSRAPPTFF